MASDPVEPAKTSVSVLAALVAVFTLLALANTLGGDLTFLRMEATACVHGANLGTSLDVSTPPDSPVRLADGVHLGVTAAMLCDSSPTGAQRALDAASHLPGFLVLVVTLLLALNLFRVIGREGLFTARAVSRMRQLGWVVVAGSLIADLTTAFATSALVASMVRNELTVGWMGYWEPSVAAVLLGTVLVSVARVLGVGAGMREDLEGTV